MDAITHAVVGAVTGAQFGHPVVGAVAAVVPDSALWLRARQPQPPALYRPAHSVLGALFAFAVVLMLTRDDGSLAGAVFYGWVSHIFLDFFTHSGEWATRPFYGWSNWHPKEFQEWEWFNPSWWLGLGMAIFWSVSCVIIL